MSGANLQACIIIPLIVIVPLFGFAHSLHYFCISLFHEPEFTDRMVPKPSSPLSTWSMGKTLNTTTNIFFYIAEMKWYFGLWLGHFVFVQ